MIEKTAFPLIVCDIFFRNVNKTLSIVEFSMNTLQLHIFVIMFYNIDIIFKLSCELTENSALRESP